MRTKPIEAIIRKFTHSRSWKRIGLSIGFIVLMLASFAVYLNHRWKPFLTAQIKEAISTSTDSLYTISFDDVSVNILTGSATFNKIIFAPDSGIYQQMIAQGKAPRHLFTVEVGKLQFVRIHPFKVYFQRKLEMRSLLISNPEVRMVYQKLSKPQDSITDDRNAYQRLSKYLRSIKVDDIVFQDADFQYIDKSARRNQVIRLQNLDINIAGLLIDSASQFNRSKLYYTDDISIQLQNYSFLTPNGLYDLKIKEFTASTKNKMAHITGLRVIPRFGEMAFSQKTKFRAERYDLRFNDILLEQIDFKTFNTDRRLIASALKISNSNSNIFLNKAMPRNEKDRKLSFPQIALRELNLETRIDTVQIRNARIAYSEYSPETKRRGYLFFDQVDAVITNLSNDSISLAKNSNSEAKLTGLIMGRGRFDAVLAFNLADKTAAYKLNGSVGNMNASLLNPILRPLTLVEVRKGFIEQMQFSLNGDMRAVKGTISVKYDDLKISILSQKENSSRLKKMGIASIAANVLVLKSENPSPGEKFRTVKINYLRPDSSSFINMNWKGMLGGLMETIGLDQKTQRKIEVKLIEIKTLKAEREQRKEERLKRREERRKNNRK